MVCLHLNKDLHININNLEDILDNNTRHNTHSRVGPKVLPVKARYQIPMATTTPTHHFNKDLVQDS
jgi:hypothetical protein